MAIFAVLLYMSALSHSLGVIPSMETLENITTNCRKPVGIKDGRVKDSSFKASSAFEKDFQTFGPHRARLDLQSWAPGYRAYPSGDQTHWIRVDLEEDMVITAIATQGYGDPAAAEWVKYFMFLYKKGRNPFDYFRDLENKIQIFKGNNDSNGTHMSLVSLPAVVRSIIIFPTDWHRNFALRFELYGCLPDYSFSAWLLTSEALFTTKFLQTDSKEWIEMAAAFQEEVTETLKTTPGFLGAKVKSLSPQMESTSENLIAAEIQIDCIRESMTNVKMKLEEMVTTGSTFNPNFFKVVYPDLNCSLPTVVLHLNKTIAGAREILSEEEITIQGEVKLTCNETDLLPFWEVSKVDETSGEFLPYLNLKNGGSDFNLSTKEMLIGLNYIRLVLKRTSSAEKPNSFDYGFLRRLAPLLAQITAPNVAVKGGALFKLDASKSRDTDERVHDQRGMRFTWLCRRQNETFSNVGDLPVDVGFGRDPTNLGCFGYGPGKLNSTNSVLVIDPSRMRSGETYVFQVVVKKDKRTATSNHTLSITLDIALSIRCAVNCARKVSTSKKLVLESDCKGQSCSVIPLFHWSLFVNEIGGSNNSWTQFENLEDIILTEVDSPDFVITGKNPDAKVSLGKSKHYKLYLTAELEEGIVLQREYQFWTNSPPVMQGGCHVNPNQGAASITEFTISCDGFHDDDVPLRYQFAYVSSFGSTMVLQSGEMKSVTTTLPLGEKEKSYAVVLTVQVIDSQGDFTEMTLEVKVFRPSSSAIAKKLKGLTDPGNSPLTGLFNSGNVGKAVQMVCQVLSLISGGESGVPGDQKKNVKDFIIGQMKDVKVQSLDQANQMAVAVAMATGEKDEISSSSQSGAMNLLGGTLNFMASQLTNSSADRGVVENVGTSLMFGIGNVLSATSEDARAEPRDKSEGEANKKEKKDAAKNALNLVSKLGDTLLSTKSIGEKPSTFKTKSMALLLDRQLPSKMGGKKLGQENTTVSLPSASALFSGEGGVASVVDSKMSSFNNNPFTWDESSKNIKSSVLEFTLQSGGKALEISGLKEPIEIYIPLPAQEAPTRNESNATDFQFVKSSNGGLNIRYHTIVIPSREMAVSVRIVPEGNHPLHIFVSYNSRPTAENHNFSTVIPDFSSCANLSEVEKQQEVITNCTQDPYVVLLTSAVTGHTGIHYLGIKYNQTHSRNKTASSSPDVRRRRSCSGPAGRIKRSCIGVKDAPTTPPPTPKIIIPKYNPETDLKYRMSITVSGCLYWSETKEKWTGEGCQVGPKSDPSKLHCLCTHLSAFGGDFLVAPNPIDFDKVFAELGRLGETGNFVVLSTICVIFGLYIIGVICARRADKKDDLKLIENMELPKQDQDNYIYNVSVQTGMWRGCGTTANVTINIYGLRDNSGPIQLTDPNSPKIFFARASENNFILTVPSSLGMLHKIRIWHDNRGAKPGWFLRQVLITDLQTDEKWDFHVNRWLAVEKADGQIGLEIEVSRKNESPGFKSMVSARVATGLGEDHLWMSVLTRPPHNPFTRAQRLSCCLSLLFAAMVTNAMFYNFGNAPTDNFQIGPISMSLIQIKIGIQSSIIALPMNVLVVMMFKSVKPAKSSNTHETTSSKYPEKKPSGCLPHFFVYIAWILSLLMSLVAATFVFFYSLMWGKETSNQWLVSIMVSFFQDVMVMQPMKVILLAWFLSSLVRKAPKDKNNADEPSQPRQRCKSLDAGKLKNDEGDNDFSMPDQQEIEEARKFRVKFSEMVRALVDIAFVLFFTLLLMVVCYSNRSVARFMLTQSMRDILIRFNKVKDASSFWSWTQAILVPSLYGTKWYNGQAFEYEEGFLSNREVFMLGMPRLRQLRVRPDSTCAVWNIDPSLVDIYPRCLSSYSAENDYRAAYNLPGWFQLSNISAFESKFELHDMCPKPWRYQDSAALQALSFQGQVNTYDGGGYVADLGYNLDSALEVLSHLKDWNWIDDKTAAVLIEFTIFEPASSLFSAVKLLFEKLPTGGALTTTRIETLVLYSASDPSKRSIYQISQLLIMIYIFFFIISEIGKVRRRKGEYFRDFWSWLEILQIVSVTSALVLFFFKEKYTSDFVEDAKENPFRSSSTDALVAWYNLETALLSFVVFIVTIKFLRIIRFNRFVTYISMTLKNAAIKIISFIMVVTIVLLSFGQMGVMLFSTQTVSYSSPYRSFITLLQILFGGGISFDEIRAANAGLGSIFICAYTFCSVMILANIFLALLIISYKNVVHQQDQVSADAEVGHFMAQYFKKQLLNFGGHIHGLFAKPDKRRKGIYREGQSRSIGGYSELCRNEEVDECKILHEEVTLCPDSINVKVASLEDDRDYGEDSGSDSDSFCRDVLNKGILLNEQSRKVMENADISEETDHVMVLHELRECFTAAEDELKNLESFLKKCPRFPRQKKKPRRQIRRRLRNEKEQPTDTVDGQYTILSSVWGYFGYFWQYVRSQDPSTTPKEPSGEDDESFFSLLYKATFTDEDS